METSSAPQNLFSVLVLTVVITNVMSVGADWCVASGSASPDALQQGLDYACGHGADCTAILPGGSCYVPNTIKDHASYAFNSYYQHMNKDPSACDFGGAATTVDTDPSYGECVYPSQHSQRIVEGANTSITKAASDEQNITPESKLKAFYSQRTH